MTSPTLATARDRRQMLANSRQMAENRLKRAENRQKAVNMACDAVTGVGMAVEVGTALLNIASAVVILPITLLTSLLSGAGCLVFGGLAVVLIYGLARVIGG